MRSGVYVAGTGTYDAGMAWVVRLPLWVQTLLLKAAIAALVILPFVSLVAMVSIWAERKIAARIQSRHGPMRVGGFHGWAQSLADGLKLIGKEDLLPAGADAFLFRLAPYLAFAPALAAFLFVPWAKDLSALTASLNVGVFFLLAVLGVEVLGVILAGWASNNKWSVYGAMREACQMVSYEIPLGLSILCAVLVAGSLNLYEISLRQSGGFPHWFLFHDPFNMLAFGIYYIAALASCKRAPFDLPESESELVAGYHTEYSGIRFSFFFFAEYAAMFVVSAIQVSLWLGAWYDPFGIVAHLETLRYDTAGAIHWNDMLLANALGAAVFIAKAAVLVFVQMWLRWTLPRLRIDQVLHLCIKVLVPVACFNLLGAAACLWLIDPLPRVQMILQIVLACVAVGIVALLALVVLHAFLTRERSTFKVLFTSSRPLPDLHGS